ncbi:hypothetical protein [Okeania sp. SIO2B3]|uniref:hypothetical protein n=1 Tax=Okeania sp. SIO2B3 TaxID=2607784 RepID=UPI0013C08203|nr:hypothetical protein [Okeania sp. SIO2B3]NET44872.1 hypothetical protein [Okeania sp. SIO2B3]
MLKSENNQPLGVSGTIFNHFWVSSLQDNFTEKYLGSTETKRPKLYVVCGKPNHTVTVAMMSTEKQAEQLAEDLNNRMKNLSY